MNKLFVFTFLLLTCVCFSVKVGQPLKDIGNNVKTHKPSVTVPSKDWTSYINLQNAQYPPSKTDNDKNSQGALPTVQDPGLYVNGSFLGCDCESPLVDSQNMRLLATSVTVPYQQQAATLFQAAEATTLKGFFADLDVVPQNCVYGESTCPTNNSEFVFDYCDFYMSIEFVATGNPLNQYNYIPPSSSAYIDPWNGSNPVLKYKWYRIRPTGPIDSRKFYYDSLNDLNYMYGFSLNFNPGDSLVLQFMTICTNNLIPVSLTGFDVDGVVSWAYVYP